MSTFKNLVTAIQNNIDSFNIKSVFVRLKVSGEDIWDTYINNFKDGDDPVFRDPESTTHTCHDDKRFIKRFGNIAVVFDGVIKPILSLKDEDVPEIYKKSMKAVADLLNTAEIEVPLVLRSKDVFVHGNKVCLGKQSSSVIYDMQQASKYGVVTAGRVYTFYHFYAELNVNMVTVFDSSSFDRERGKMNTNYDVFNRGLSKTTIDALKKVDELLKEKISSRVNMYTDRYLLYKQMYRKYANKPSMAYATELFVKNPSLRTFMNTSFGDLIKDVSSATTEQEIDTAVRQFNSKISEENYMRTSAPVSISAMERASLQVEDLGYTSAFNRRLAVVEDIDEAFRNFTNFTNKKKTFLFDKIKTDSNASEADFSEVPSITFDQLMNDVLPKATNVQAYITNNHLNNLFALTTAVDKDAKKLFKWDNHFAWSYKNNLTGASKISREVANKKGNINGILRFSIMWNEDGRAYTDLDAHCDIKGKNVNQTIFYASKKYLNASLDVDIQSSHALSVENIVFPDMSMFKSQEKYTFTFYVKNYSDGNHYDNTAELKIEDKLYAYKLPVNFRGRVDVCKVTYDPMKLSFEVDHYIQPTNKKRGSSEVGPSTTEWGVTTNKFTDVDLVCNSPNYWENASGVKHCLLALNGCVPDIELTTIHAEFLNQELQEFRRVITPFADTIKVKAEPDSRPVAGVGFTDGSGDGIVLKVVDRDNKTNLYNVKF